MLTYATLQTFAKVKGISLDLLSDEDGRMLREYLRRGTREIDRITRRRFFPFHMTRRYSIPMTYADLRNRALIHEDLQLDADLMEVVRVQVGTGTVIDSGEDVPLGGLTAIATTFTATDADGLDDQNIDRFAVGVVLQIKNEQCVIRARDTGTNVVTLERGAFGTIAAAHAAGVQISKNVLTTLEPGIDFHLLDFNINPKFAIRLVFPNTWAGRYTGVAWRSRYPQIYVTGFWGFHDQMQEAWVNTNDPIPSGGITAVATTWNALAVDGTDAANELRFLVDHLYRVENELMWLTAADDNTGALTVLRGQHGTLVAAHAAGTPVYRFAVLEDIRKSCFNIAKTLRDSDDSVGGRQGVTEVSVGVKITYAADVAETLKHYIRSYIA